jgi:hypothetical protein
MVYYTILIYYEQNAGVGSSNLLQNVKCRVFVRMCLGLNTDQELHVTEVFPLHK